MEMVHVGGWRSAAENTLAQRTPLSVQCSIGVHTLLINSAAETWCMTEVPYSIWGPDLGQLNDQF